MYLDTAILVKLLVREPDTDFYVQLTDGQPAVWSSQVAIAELCSALLRKEREGAIEGAQRTAAWRQARRHVATGELRLVPVTASLLDAASGILETCHPDVPLRTLDALHLASYLESRSPPLVTSDRIMRAAAKRLRMDLAALP